MSTQNIQSASQQSPVTVNWEGSLLVHHSLAMVNRELLLCLVRDNRFDIRHIPWEPDQFTIDSDSRLEPLRGVIRHAHTRAQIHIRHRWPPDFSRPSCDKYVLIQPWEYGTLLSSWIEPIADTVDEIWVPSRFVKDSYISSGVPSGKIFVVPNGIDPNMFSPAQEPAHWIETESPGCFRFLYNGGVTIRKGADLLVRAYLNEFKADEPVCLVIKDSQVYGKGLAEKVKAIAAHPQAPKILYTSREIAPAQLGGLYTACDCYVQPYRAEGYGLPLAEASACDLPVITTGGGACVDFLDEADAYFVDFQMERFPQRQIDGQTTAGNPFWLLADVADLQKRMRNVFEHPDEARDRGRRMGAKIREHHTWEHAARVATSRLFALSGNDRAISEDSAASDAAASIEAAVAQFRSSDYIEAARTFRRCLLDQSSRSAAYEGLGLVAHAQDRLEESFDLFRRADQVSPGIPDIVLNWAETARKLGRLGELRHSAEAALKNGPHDQEILRLLQDSR